MRGIFVFGLLLGACGGGGSTASDAPVVPPDDIVIDAPPDAPPDGPPTPAGVHRWVIDRQRVPTTNMEARDFGLDLNGDSSVDNQLGMVFGALASQGFDVQGATDAAVSRGQILLLAEANVGTPTAATFTLYTGANPVPAPCNGATDTVCRRHLAGTGSFDLAAASAHDPPLTGTLMNGTLTAGPGSLHVPLVIFGSAPVTVELIGARVKLEMVAGTGLAQSVIAGAVTQAELDAKVYPGIHQGTTAAVAADCTTTTPPDCGCAVGSTGRTFINLFDTNPKNCVITIDEIKNNALIMSLFAPDVTIGGQQALSLGFAATAVKATFTP